MTRKVVVVIVCAAVLSCGAVLAYRGRWEPTDRPAVSLRLALTLAEEALANEEVRYHCIDATLEKTSPKGEWHFAFASKDGKRIWVKVTSDAVVMRSPFGFDY